MRARHKRRADGEAAHERRAATRRKSSKPRVSPPKEVPVTEEQLAVLLDYLQEHLGITLAQAKRAARAIKPGSRVFERQSRRNPFLHFLRQSWR